MTEFGPGNKYDDLYMREERPLLEFPHLLYLAVILFSFMLGGSLLVFPWPYVLAGFLGIILLAAIFFDLYLALLVFLIGAIFHPTYHITALKSLHPARNLAFLVIFLWIVHAIVYRDIHFVKTKQTLFLIGFLICMFISSTYYFDYSFPIFLEMGTKAFVLYFIIVSLINSRKRLIYLIRFLVCCSIVSASSGIYQYIHHIGVYYAPEGILRICGPDEDPNVFATNLTLSLPLVFALFYGSTHKRVKALLLGVAALLIVTVILTFSRAGMIQLCVVLWLSVGLRLMKKYKAVGIIFILILLAIGAYLVPVKYFERMETMVNFSDPAIGKRLDGWKVGMDMIHDNPFKGVGFGLFRYEFLERSVTGTDSRFKLALAAHNLFIQTTAEMGVFGLAFLMLIIYCVFSDLKKAGRQFLARGDIVFGEITKALWISFFVFLLGGMFISYLQLLIFWIMIPLAVVLKYFSTLPRQDYEPA